MLYYGYLKVHTVTWLKVKGTEKQQNKITTISNKHMIRIIMSIKGG